MRFHTRAAHTSWGFDTREDRADTWRDNAACRNQNPEMFFADTRGAIALATADIAKAVCRGCTVLTQCAAWVKDNPQEFGIFAGLTADERRGLPAPKPKPRWCQRCGDRFEWDVSRPDARVCLACVVSEERHGTRRELEKERVRLSEGATR